MVRKLEGFKAKCLFAISRTVVKGGWLLLFAILEFFNLARTKTQLGLRENVSRTAFAILAIRKNEFLKSKTNLWIAKLFSYLLLSSWENSNWPSNHAKFFWRTVFLGIHNFTARKNKITESNECSKLGRVSIQALSILKFWHIHDKSQNLIGHLDYRMRNCSFKLTVTEKNFRKL